nr:hypothetical protein [Tanacetum cinerariifolium]
VQNALQTLLPQIRTEIREEFRTSSGPSDSGGNPLPGLRKSTLNHLMCFPFTDVAQVANAARNYEILHERGDDDADRPDKQQKSGDRHQPTTQQSSHRNHDHNHDRHGSDRRGGSDNHLNSNNNYSGNNNSTCFKCGQTGHLKKDCKKNTTTSTSGQADKKPGASGRVF